MAVDGSLIFDTKVDTKEFSRDTKSIKLMLDSLKSGFGKLDAAAVAIEVFHTSWTVGIAAAAIAAGVALIISAFAFAGDDLKLDNMLNASSSVDASNINPSK